LSERLENGASGLLGTRGIVIDQVLYVLLFADASYILVWRDTVVGDEDSYSQVDGVQDPDGDEGENAGECEKA